MGTSRSGDEIPQANAGIRPAANTSAVSGAPDPNAVPAPEKMGDAALTRIYRVGAGDVLDIHLLNAATQGSTLFTVLPSGLLDYPLAGEPLSVAGLTTDDIKTRLAAKIKIYDRPLVDVGVREYASHTVIVNGLVGTPGAKVLRREAVPLYVIMAEAEPKPEAARIRVNRLTGESALVELDAADAMNTLVHPGDVVTVLARPSQFYYIGGEVKEPGEKSFRSGITLTQALLASGGLTRGAGTLIKVARQGADGRLVTNRYNVKEIYSGKILDPVIEAGDRIDVSH